MNYIAIFPYSKRTSEGIESPKNYPYWKELVQILSNRGYEVIQVSPFDEEKIEGVKYITGALPFKSIVDLVERAYTYISVDSFAPHLLHPYKRGIVIFGVSDPNLYGYAKNINLLKSRMYLKKEQFFSMSSYRRIAQPRQLR